jgi:acyl-CoA thioester hydrolase
MTLIPYSEKFTVKSNVIDHFNHVNNLEYIRWVLYISKKHWNSVSPIQVREAYGWMIVKHELHYKGQAKLGDVLLLKTCIESFSTVKCHRKTVIKDYKTDKIIFESLAQWCFVSINTQKPTRIKAEILNPYFKDL